MVPPLPPAESRALQALGARRGPGSALAPASIVSTLRRLGAESPQLLALFDARGIAGERHLLSAWAHLGRGRARGESRLRDRSAEFALYVAGDDQLPRALAKVGVAADTEEFVLVAERPREPGPLLDAFELVADPSVYPRPPTEAVLERLGITAVERQVVPASAWEGLVLERVAFVELSAASGGAPAKAKP
jgi:tRNA threonylcarbamoyladenosine modification (KEOPS) complex Cgi121 subunit